MASLAFPVSAVIFDVDGVLVDSYEPHYQSWLEFARRRGWRFSREEFVKTFGRTSREILLETWGSAEATWEDLHIAHMDDEKESIYRDLIADHCPIMEGASALIDALHQAGLQIAVGSSGPPENVELVLRHVDPLHKIRGVVTGRDVQRGKPDPQVFLTAAHKLGVPPNQCIVVEDAPAGIEAAHRAGMRCVGILSTGRTPEQLVAAELRVHSLVELTPEIFRQLH